MQRSSLNTNVKVSLISPQKRDKTGKIIDMLPNFKTNQLKNWHAFFVSIKQKQNFALSIKKKGYEKLNTKNCNKDFVFRTNDESL